MRETTSSCGAASSSGALKRRTPSAMPLSSSINGWNAAVGIVGTNSTPSTSSRASTSAQPAFDIVVGSRIFLRLVCADWGIGISLALGDRRLLGPTVIALDLADTDQIM